MKALSVNQYGNMDISSDSVSPSSWIKAVIFFIVLTVSRSSCLEMKL